MFSGKVILFALIIKLYLKIRSLKIISTKVIPLTAHGLPSILHELFGCRFIPIYRQIMK